MIVMLKKEIKKYIEFIKKKEIARFPFFFLNLHLLEGGSHSLD